MIHSKFLATILLVFTPFSLLADTLHDVVADVLETNPVVQERLKNFRAIKEEVGIAEAGYYPTLDLQVGAGKKYTNRIHSDALEETYDIFQNALVLRQNIFNGFRTKEQVQYQKMRTLAAAYSYLEKANDITLQTVKAYVALFKERALLENSRINVQHNEMIYKKVQKAYKAGLTTLSEVSKIRSSLSLARSNMTVQKNRLLNAMFNYQKITGHPADIKNLQKPRFDLKLPNTLEKAISLALRYNPSLMVGKYNINGAKALYEESKSAFYPRIDVEVSGNYNDDFNEFQGRDDRIQGMVVKRYNLFNGGADEATRRSRLSKLNQEIDVTEELRRQVVQGVELSWSAYELAKEQIPFLKRYKEQSEKTLELYSKEYDMGQRSLLDLLAAENDLKRARDELIKTRYDLLLAKYRIFDAMGLILSTLSDDEEKYYRKVGIASIRDNGMVKRTKQ
jgi:adhesin transport system outer membrane protein